MAFRESLKKKILNRLSSLYVWEATYQIRPQMLTVLAYHRVVESSGGEFDTFRPNVSASPAEFKVQMDYVKSHFDIVDVEALIAWLHGDRSLPRRPLLITFDDGYRDNFEFAYPVLRSANLPAVLFITTGFIDGQLEFYWDQLAFAFHHTEVHSLHTKTVGNYAWKNPAERQRSLKTVIGRLKRLPEIEKLHLVDEILTALNFDHASYPGSTLAMSWEQVRELSENGIDIGGHTNTHPILSKITEAQAKLEIGTCLDIIERRLGERPAAFAYTNGLENDFSQMHEDMLRDEGVEAAFSLVPGPSRLREVQQRPLAIRRVMIHHRDDLPRFKAKLAGAARLFQKLF